MGVLPIHYVFVIGFNTMMLSKEEFYYHMLIVDAVYIKKKQLLQSADSSFLGIAFLSKTLVFIRIFMFLFLFITWEVRFFFLGCFFNAYEMGINMNSIFCTYTT